MRSQPNASRPLRVLIVRVGAMGDVLHAMPAVAGLRATLPDAVIGWAIEPRWLPLLRASEGSMPLVDRVHPVRTREWKGSPLSTVTLRGIVGLRSELHDEQYGVCVDLQGSIKSGAIGLLAGADRFVGPAAPREQPARLFYKERTPLKKKNVIDQACELISVATDRKIAPANFPLPVDPFGERWCGEKLGANAEFVLIAPTAGWGAKEWGAGRYSELAQRLRDAGIRVAVNAAAGSPPGVAEQIARASGAMLLSSTLEQLIALSRRAALVIGGDTGPMHLAAALGRPVVALFGPTDPVRNGPAFVGCRVKVLRDPASATDHGRHQETEAGLARIRVEEVLTASLAMLSGSEGD